MEITTIEVEGQLVGLDLEDGMLNIYTGDQLRGAVRVAEPAPEPWRAPEPWTYTDAGVFGFPNGWSLRNGIVYDDLGAIVPEPGA